MSQKAPVSCFADEAKALAFIRAMGVRARADLIETKHRSITFQVRANCEKTMFKLEKLVVSESWRDYMEFGTHEKPTDPLPAIGLLQGQWGRDEKLNQWNFGHWVVVQPGGLREVSECWNVFVHAAKDGSCFIELEVDNV